MGQMVYNYKWIIKGLAEGARLGFKVRLGFRV